MTHAPLTGPDWARISDMFDRVADRAPAEQERLAGAALGDRPELRALLLAMLRADRRDSLLDATPFGR